MMKESRIEMEVGDERPSFLSFFFSVPPSATPSRSLLVVLLGEIRRFFLFGE